MRDRLLAVISRCTQMPSLRVRKDPQGRPNSDPLDRDHIFVGIDHFHGRTVPFCDRAEAYICSTRHLYMFCV